RATIAELFATERDAIRLVKVKEVVERLEEAADAFEALADGVELLAMREG
ncbi:MAG: Phosphate transport regulator, partial [Actinomyces urogenitalis DORA_12]